MTEIKRERFPLRLLMAFGSGACQQGAGELVVADKISYGKAVSGTWNYVSAGYDKNGKPLNCGELDWLEEEE